MKRCFLSIIVVCLGMILASCSNESIDGNMSQDVADFEFTTQDNKAFGLKDLKGDWWLANFMYTSCTIVCPTTTPNMAMVQDAMEQSGLDAQFVSFSVDPENDTPEVLKEYTKQYPVNLDNWHFLTGYDFKDIKNLSNNSFQTVLASGGPDSHEFSHSTSFFLVNPDGEIVKRYDGMSTKEMDVIIEDMKKIL